MSKPCGTSGYEAATTTLVRMAFKAFELGFPCIFGELDPTVGALAESQKAKLDKMKDWLRIHSMNTSARMRCHITDLSRSTPK